VPVSHAHDRLLGPAHPVQDLLVFDLELGIALGLLGDLEPVGVVLPGVGRDIGQDGHLVDVGAVFGVDAFELWVQSFVAGAWLPTTRQQLHVLAAALDIEWTTMASVVQLCSQAWGIQ